METARANRENFKPHVLPTQHFPSPKGSALISPLLTEREVKQRYHVTDRTIYRLVAEGRLRAYQPNGRVLYAAWECEQVFTNAKPGLASPPVRRVTVNEGERNGNGSEDPSKVGYPQRFPFVRDSARAVA